MNKIYKIDEVPEEENIYLAKDKLGWRVVHPIKNEDGKINWFNFLFGSWSNLIILLFWLILIATFFLAYNEVAKQLTSCLHPVLYSIPIDVPAGVLSWRLGS